MSATRPATKTELRDYALRRLGYPTIDINVASAQLDDLIEETLLITIRNTITMAVISPSSELMTDAIKTAAKSTTQMGSTDWYEGNEYVSLPPGVMSVNRVFSQIGASSIVPGNIFNIKYQIFLNDIYSMTHGQILHYYMTSQYLETLDWVTNNNNSRRVRFNEHQGRLYLDFDWEELQVGDFILVEVLMRRDPKPILTCIMITWMRLC